LEVLFQREAFLQAYNQLELLEYPGAHSALYGHFVFNYALCFLKEKKMIILIDLFRYPI
jgi:hypothetical protein